jgi:hypothetical protein
MDANEPELNRANTILIRIHSRLLNFAVFGAGGYRRILTDRHSIAYCDRRTVILYWIRRLICWVA